MRLLKDQTIEFILLKESFNLHCMILFFHLKMAKQTEQTHTINPRMLSIPPLNFCLNGTESTKAPW